MANNKEKIIQYYDTCEIDYRLFWNLDKSLAMHAGFWDNKVRNLEQALRRENEILAEMAAIKKGDKVLDAGCGIGGSSFFLAQEVGCFTTGISICEKQIEKAKHLAKVKKLDHVTHFEVMDYCCTDFDNESFDVIWALESVSHTQHKANFIKEAYRLLRPGGKIIVADGFSNLGHSHQKMSHWLNGWAMPDLETLSNFENNLKNCKFKNINIVDMTSFVIPSSVRLFLISLPGWILSKCGEFFGLRTETQTNNIKSAYYQYITLKQKLWNYSVIIANK